MEYKDYYAIMGLEREATQDEVRRAYRKLARKYHPDVSKADNAEERFKELGEAYEVLKDPEKRAAYDQLGSQWQAGQEFHPPPGWDAGFEYSGPGDGFAESAFSDFFETLYGQPSGRPGRVRPGRDGFQMRGQDHHAKIVVDLQESYAGTSRSISLQVPEVTADGHVRTRTRTLNVRIPKGIRQGQQIRLAGQGGAAYGGGEAGDLFLEVAFEQSGKYRVEGADVYLDLPIAPWEAALGATIEVPTPSGNVDLKIPANARAGQKLRLKGRGIPASPPGDLYLVLQLVLPRADTEKARDMYRQMRQTFEFNPRSTMEA